MQHVIRIGAAAVLAAALAGSNPAQQREARSTGDDLAAKSRAVAQKAAKSAQDEALAQKVKTAMSLRKGLDTRRIEINADARTGVVRLEGSVPNMQERQSGGRGGARNGRRPAGRQPVRGCRRAR